MAKALSKILLLILVLSGCGFAGLCVYTQTDAGRRFVQRRIESVVTENIPGRLEIGHLEHVGFSRVSATQVRFFHPDGRCVLLAQHAEVVPDFTSAAHGRLGFYSASVDGGYFLLSLDSDGRASIEAALSAPRKPGEPHDPKGGLHYALRSMHIQHFRLLAHLSEQFDYRVQGMTGFVSVRRIETPGVQVTLERISGELVPEVAGAHVALEQVDGFIHGKERQVMHLDAQLRIGSGKLVTRIDYFDRRKAPISVRIVRSSGVEAELMAWLVRALATFSSDIKVKG